MIPVTLRLTNFLSYGTEAPTLDFEQFHVACLSGRNGQGKSALLDAITWALWGEARKSSDSRKPDDELIRIGTRHMEVELVFDLEADRYRVVRTYQRSASGKTSKPGLEVAVRESGSGDFRPLTGGSLRETQANLDALLGIDYDTFINSAFLLQGRSDEFTKKRPSDRKQILARILNLSRFDRLADLARSRQRDAEATMAQAEKDIERLDEALAREPGWKEEREELQEVIAAAETRLEVLREDERRLSDRLAALDVRAREADALRRNRDAVVARIDALTAEAAALTARIASADALIAKRDEIRRDFERRVALDEERDALETCSQLHRGVEKQIEAKTSELKDRRTELEKTLHRTEVELASNRRALADAEARLVEEPALRRALDDARTALKEAEALGRRRAERRAQEERLTVLERTLVAERETLRGQLESLDTSIAEARAAVSGEEALKARAEALERAAEQREGILERVNETLLRGQSVAESLHELAGELKLREEALAAITDRAARFTDTVEAAGGVCPTCGSELSGERGADVEAHFRAERARIETELERVRAAMAKRSTERERLLAAFREAQAEAAAFDAVPEQLGAVRERLAAAATLRGRLGEQEGAAAELRRRLEEKDYGHEQRERYRTLKAELDAAPFDEEAYERVREKGAQVERFTERLETVEQARGRRDQLVRTVRAQEKQAETLHRQLDEGTAFEALEAQLAALREQLAGVGYDGARHVEVRRALQALSEAAARFRDLENAQQNRSDWQAALDRNRTAAEAAGAERARAAAALEALEKELGARDEAERERAAAAAARAALEDELSTRNRLYGEVQARLEQAARDREQLRSRRAVHAAAKKERSLYGHLRRAFGRHGIQSLIIEQTLPEIEDRANTLLERLTDGRMNVRLETLKDKKSGGTKETLDIIITDEQGVPRAYETFSGGEAFRVNFALRIALAQLLAERSGVRVRTLVIDEGFGTQDAQGVQNMVEAIQTVREDFDKILVITHLSALKEAFPVRIEVEKDPVDGSSFEVLGV